MMSNKYNKLHPISALINFFKGLKDLFLPIIFLLLVNGFNFSFNVHSENFWSQIIPLVIMLIAIISSLITGLLKWWTFVYWFEEDELRVKYGLFVKKKRYIPFERIQSFNYKEGIFHRILGLVQIQVETAGGKTREPEVILTAITKEAAKQIEMITSKEKNGSSTFIETDIEENIEELQSTKIFKMKTKDLIILATTSNGIGVVLTGVFAAYSQIAQFISMDKFFKEFSGLIKFGVITIIFAVFLTFFFAWIASVIITLINFYDFTIIKENDRITITRGLLEKKRITIPLNRIQAVKIDENPFRQIFGLASVAIESASGGLSEKEYKVTLFPLISMKFLYIHLKELFPDLECDFTLTKPPKIAKPVFYRIKLLLIIPIVVACSYIWFPYGMISLLLVIPVILLGIWQYKTAGVSINGSQLTFVYRRISRVTFLVDKKRIQALECKQSFFQKSRELSSIQATVMSGTGGARARTPHLKLEDVESVMAWFEKAPKNKE